MARYFVVLYLFIFLSCNKESVSNPIVGDYYIKAKINDEEIKFISTAFGRVEATSIHGSSFKQTTSNFPSFSFDIEPNTSILPNATYNEVTTNLIFRYSLSGTQIYNSQMGSDMDFEFKISEIKSEFFRGSFSGTIRTASNTSDLLQVSEGEFILKR